MATVLTDVLPQGKRITAPLIAFTEMEITVPGDTRSFTVQFLDSAGNPVAGRFAFVYAGLAGGLLAADYWTVFSGATVEFKVEGRSRNNAGEAYSLWVACSAASGTAEIVVTR